MTHLSSSTVRAGFCSAALLFTGALHAANTVVTLDASDRGWLSSGDNHFPGNTNYIAGISNQNQEYHNWFAFDLTGFSADITSATLNLFLPSDGYGSDKPGETFSLFDVSTPASQIKNALVDQDAFTDLGSGVVYGQSVVTRDQATQIVSISLNADGLAALNNARGGVFLVGGSVTSADISTLPGYEYLFGWTSDLPLSTTTLSITAVPEPCLPVLLGAGALLGLRRRRA